MQPSNETDPVIGETDDLDDVVLERAAAIRSGRPLPEASMEAAALTIWDQPAGALGHRIPPLPGDGEENIPDQLVSAGNEEADREQRIAATAELEEQEQIPED